jgi:hypothetical protein
MLPPVGKSRSGLERFMRGLSTAKRILAASGILLIAFAVSAVAGSNLYYKVALHVVSSTERTCESGRPDIHDCDGINTTYQGCGEFDVFPVFFDLVEVRRIEYALIWPVEWGTCAFTACAGDNVIGDIVSAGDGIAHEWTGCRQAQILIPGYARFSASTSPGIVALGTNPTTGFLGVTDCQGNSDLAIGVSAAGVCGIPGEDPCDCGCDSGQRTWGAIKSMFR